MGVVLLLIFLAIIAAFSPRFAFRMLIALGVMVGAPVGLVMATPWLMAQWQSDPWTFGIVIAGLGSLLIPSPK